MKHLDLTQWTDYVRGLSPPAEERAAIEQHLSSGCSECLQSVDFLNRVAMASRADSQIPEALVENAKALFAIRRLERPPQLPRIAAKLVYDSFHDPLPQGVRSSQRTSRQAFYEAGDYCLDLRLEVEPDQREFSLVGQIANRKRPSEHMADIPVFLLSGEDVLASTSSSQFGEFHMEHSYQRTLRLCLPILTPGKLIEVPLSRLLTGGSTGKQKD